MARVMFNGTALRVDATFAKGVGHVLVAVEDGQVKITSGSAEPYRLSEAEWKALVKFVQEKVGA